MEPLFADSLEKIEWYHPYASRHVAETLLMQNGRLGSYLLRPSTRPDTLALSVRAQESVVHFPLTRDAIGGKFKLGQMTLATVDELVQHFINQPLLAGESGLLTLFQFPYPRTVAEPSQYEVIRLQAQLGPSMGPVDVTDLTLGSKEGFITKRGGFIKNWKVRWFVLKRMELRYYVNRVDVEPLKILDLHQCIECANAYTVEGHEHCFRIVFPWRIFYCCASTSAESQEWIQLVNWKLERMRLNKRTDRQSQSTGNLQRWPSQPLL